MTCCTYDVNKKTLITPALNLQTMWYSINVYFCSSHKLEIISQKLLKILFSSIHDEFLVLSFKVYDDIISA